MGGNVKNKSEEKEGDFVGVGRVVSVPNESNFLFLFGVLCRITGEEDRRVKELVGSMERVNVWLNRASRWLCRNSTSSSMLEVEYFISYIAIKFSIL